MKPEEKQKVEHQYWLEYVEIGVLVEHRSDGRKTMNILHMDRVNFT